MVGGVLLTIPAQEAVITLAPPEPSETEIRVVGCGKKVTQGPIWRFFILTSLLFCII
jgi:hypothetical protein